MTKSLSSAHQHTILVVDPQAGDGGVKTIPPTPGLEILPIQELRAGPVRFTQDCKVCVTAIAPIDDVLPRLDDEARRSAIETMRDKYAFRRLLGTLFPDITFRRIQLRELPQLTLVPHVPYIIK